MKTLGPDELRELGIAEVGERVMVDPTVRIFGAANIRIGSDVRIDAFSILSAGVGGIVIGDFVHIAAHAFLAGAGAITLEDFVGLSGRVSVYSSNDDYSGATLTGPMTPFDLRDVTTAPVKFGRHSIIGAGTVVLPGVTLHEGACVGAMSLVNRDIEPFTIAAGIPAVPIRERERGMLECERQLRERIRESG